ncbi:excinuclease ABC subunit UvrC [bacterium]|nr:excinuclease ABC subunit UvrC [bacterium]
MRQRLLEKVKLLPQSPGCYIYKNRRGRVIYVGKAKNLRARVGSYFHSGIAPGTKTHKLVSQINDIEHIETESELEALILEAKLIKKYKPRYNIVLKDDKSLLYIVGRTETLPLAGKRIRLPKILTVRKTDLLPKDVTFGPYPDATTAKQVLKYVRKVFPFRDCSPAKFSRYSKLGRMCLFGTLEVCGGPCVNYSLEDIREYRKNVNRIKKLLSGESVAVLRDLTTKMKEHSKKQEYEEAKRCRDVLGQFEYVRQSFRDASDYIKNPYLLDDLAQNAMIELQEVLPILSTLPRRIECYDISNISGKEAVGSMVVATNGRIDKKEYRRFKVRTKNTPDDFGMMQEVLARRLKRKDWGIPDLIVLDGGKGQVGAVLKTLKDLDASVPIIGLAKKQELVVYKYRNKFVELTLAENSEGHKLVVSLRNEAHRFAQAYHHLLRSKKLKQT